MTFRNPITSIRGEQISGVLTGVVVRSAPDGNRFELRQDDDTGTLEFYAGVGGETPATISASTLPGEVPAQMLTIAGDVNVSDTRPAMRLYSEASPEGGWRSRIDLDAEAITIAGRPFRDGYAWHPTLGWLRRSYAGSTIVAVTSGTNNPGSLPLGLTIPNATQYVFTLQNADTGAQSGLNVHGHVRVTGDASAVVFRYSGATAGNARIDWTAILKE